MNPVTEINQSVDVIAAFYKEKGNTHSVIATPKFMRLAGRDIQLTRLGLHHKIYRDGHIIHVFDVSDGANDYRLEFNASLLSWTLVSMIDGSNL